MYMLASKLSSWLIIASVQARDEEKSDRSTDKKSKNFF